MRRLRRTYVVPAGPASGGICRGFLFSGDMLRLRQHKTAGGPGAFAPGPPAASYREPVKAGLTVRTGESVLQVVHSKNHDLQRIQNVVGVETLLCAVSAAYKGGKVGLGLRADAEGGSIFELSGVGAATSGAGGAGFAGNGLIGILESLHLRAIGIHAESLIYHTDHQLTA